MFSGASFKMKKIINIFFAIILASNSGLAQYMNYVFGTTGYQESLTYFENLHDSVYFGLGSHLNLSTLIGEVKTYNLSNQGIIYDQKTFSIQNSSISLKYYQVPAFNKSDSTFLLATGLFENTTGHGSGLLMDFNKNGDTLWTKIFTDDSLILFSGIAKTNNGYLCMGITSKIDAAMDILLLKIDFSGNELWRKTLSYPRYQFGTSIVETFDKGFFISGVETTTQTDYERIYFLIDSLGNVIWKKVELNFGYADQNPVGIQLADSTFLIATGSTDKQNFPPVGVSFGRARLQKRDTSGNVIWTKFYGDTVADQTLIRVKELADGNLLASGYGWDYGTSTYQATMLKTNFNGDSVFFNGYNYNPTTNQEFIFDFHPLSNGGFIGCGVVTSLNDNWLVSIDSFGCIVSGCVTGVEEQTEANVKSIICYPNPSSLSFINFSTRLPIVSFLVYDYSGKIILEKNIQNSSQIQINISDFPNGIYLIDVLDNRANHLFSKFSVQKN